MAVSLAPQFLLWANMPQYLYIRRLKLCNRMLDHIKKALWLLYVPPALMRQNSTFCPHSCSARCWHSGSLTWWGLRIMGLSFFWFKNYFCTSCRVNHVANVEIQWMSYESDNRNWWFLRGLFSCGLGCNCKCLLCTTCGWWAGEIYRCMVRFLNAV
jgi:hypothetical protein